MGRSSKAILLHASSETDSNIYYATRFVAPDPFTYLDTGRLKVLVTSELELGRATREAEVNKVISYTELKQEAKERGILRPKLEDLIMAVLRRYNVKDLLVPDSFPVGLADALRKKGVNLKSKGEPFFESRGVKTWQEIQRIKQAQQAVQKAMRQAIDIIKGSRIKGQALIYQSIRLTSEYLQQTIQEVLLKEGCIGKVPIVACGEQGCDPHCLGSGPLRPHQPIIIDISARSRRMYCADMTRTVVKGRPSLELVRMFEAVRQAQRLGFEAIRDGVDGKAVHRKLERFFKDLGYKTERKGNRMVGFFHGTGHGIGLDIHEPPRISKTGNILKRGNVVTVEPGLYYPGVGCVRIEDMVVVGRRGVQNLTYFPKCLAV